MTELYFLFSSNSVSNLNFERAFLKKVLKSKYCKHPEMSLEVKHLKLSDKVTPVFVPHEYFYNDFYSILNFAFSNR